MTTTSDPPTAPPGRPPVVDLATWQAARDELLVREKAHTREGDALAATVARVARTYCNDRVAYILEGGYDITALTQSVERIIAVHDGGNFASSGAEGGAVKPPQRDLLNRISLLR